jgi:hypothetical protein
MRKYTLLVALVGVIFATAVAFPNLADALTFSAPAGVLNAAAAADVAKPEQVYWRRWGYRPRTYYYG